MNPENLTWRLLTSEELTNVYLNEMRRDFPAGELKPLSMILNSEAAGAAHTWGVYEDDALVAYLLMVRPVSCEVSQLDYFAVLPQYRAGGIGAALLAACLTTRRVRRPSSLKRSAPKRPRMRPWLCAAWAFTPGAGPRTSAGQSISLMPGSGCWCSPAAAERCAAPRKPCGSWQTATAAPWASPVAQERHLLPPRWRGGAV